MSARKYVILRRMAEVKEMCKLVKYVDSDDYDQLTTGKKQTEEAALRELSNLYIKTKRFRKPSSGKVSGIIYDALEHRYIKFLGDVNNGYILDTTTKGRKFIARSWFIYPTGRIEESMKAYPETRALFLSVANLITAVLAASISAVVTYLLSR